MSNLYIFNTNRKDYEFLGFKFNGHHCSEYGLTAVTPSGLNQSSLFADFEDKILEVSGRDGAYYFGTKVKTKSITLSLAFDNFTSANKKSILTWLNPNTVSQIIFDEAPYKYYWVKIAASPTFSFIPFEILITNGKQHIFKGTIDIQFIAIDPYGYSDYALVSDVPIWNGTVWTTYSNYPTNTTKFYDSTHIPGWYGESGLHFSAPSPDLAYANSTNGYITETDINPGNLTPNFYNGGEVESAIEFTIYLSAFSSTTVWQFKNITPTVDEIFELESLQNISTLSADAGPWKIICTPKTGSVIGYTDTDSYVTPYYLGALHNGFFLKVYPGENILNTNKILLSTTIKYKYKYW